LRIENAAKAYKEFSDHDFVKSYISFEGGEHGELGEEKSESPQKKRKRNGTEV